MSDLIDQTTLVGLLSTISQGQLTSGQRAQLPLLAQSASRFTRKWCNRQFTRAVRDELYTVGPNEVLLLREFPVNAISQVRTNPQTVVTIGNTDTTTNQYAFVQLVTTGSADAGFVVMGVNLLRTASGVVAAPVSIDFATHATVASLATAVNAAGAGWQAAAVDTYRLYPTADFAPIQDGIPALGSNAAELKIHTDFVLPRVDKDTGALLLSLTDVDPVNSQKFGPFFSTAFGDTDLVGHARAVRVKYDAGFDPIPEDLQLAVAEVVWASLQFLRNNPALKGETDGKYTWQGRDMFHALPPYAQQILDLYVSHRA